MPLSWLELYHGKKGASIKIEARGKYAGVKVHLDGEEAKEFLEYVGASDKQLMKKSEKVLKFASKLGAKIEKLVEEIPNLFEDRTEEQIKESMNKDLEKILAQQHAMGEGKDWKKVKS